MQGPPAGLCAEKEEGPSRTITDWCEVDM